MFALSQASSKRILMWGSLLGFNSTWSLPAGTFRTGEGNENSESLRNENSESLRLLWLLDVHLMRSTAFSMYVAKMMPVFVGVEAFVIFFPATLRGDLRQPPPD